ncbi:MAG: hypothetical protein AAF587_29035 [Bacteroidota bacterium]
MLFPNAIHTYLIFLLVTVGLLHQDLFAQETDDRRDISLLVTDDHNLPLSGVSLIAKGCALNTLTDEDGRYNGKILSSIQEIIVSYYTYQSVGVQITNKDFVHVVLKKKKGRFRLFQRLRNLFWTINWEW